MEVGRAHRQKDDLKERVRGRAVLLVVMSFATQARSEWRTGSVEVASGWSFSTEGVIINATVGVVERAGEKQRNQGTPAQSNTSRAVRVVLEVLSFDTRTCRESSKAEGPAAWC